ncbi:MAG: hypothetical protein K6B70_07170 [Clostridia bacterium]|nr:hypothetical protein [Clostridia bacterium]
MNSVRVLERLVIIGSNAVVQPESIILAKPYEIKNNLVLIIFNTTFTSGHHR